MLRTVTDGALKSTPPTITARPTPQEKRAFAALAAQRQISESTLALIAIRAWLNLQSPDLLPTPSSSGPALDRITIRLRPGDRLAIRARAAERRMKDSGYIAALVRGHVAANPPLTTASYSDVGILDFGVGYRAGWLRGDVTVSWSAPTFTGSTAAASPGVTARFDVIATLFNLYVDLGNWYGVTPYVGGGIGFSWLHPSAFNSVSLPSAIRGDTYDFSWDVTAGVSYPLTRQFLIDTSYRYLHMGTPQSNLGTILLDYGSMDAHEFKAGFRYMID